VTGTLKETTARLLDEKEMLAKALATPGVQLIFVKLKDMAKASLYDYDNCDFSTDRGKEMAHRIQARRYVILQEIPRMVDTIINVDIPMVEGRKKWRFNTFLEQMRNTLSRFFHSN